MEKFHNSEIFTERVWSRNTKVKLESRITLMRWSILMRTPLFASASVSSHDTILRVELFRSETTFTKIGEKTRNT